MADTALEADDSLEDLLGDLGIVNAFAAATPEEEFYNEIVAGKMPKIANARYWLQHEIYKFDYLTEYHLVPMRAVGSSTGTRHSPISVLEFARHMLRYYFQMMHMPRFMDLPARKACDMEKFLDYVLEEPTIKRTINGAKNN